MSKFHQSDIQAALKKGLWGLLTTAAALVLAVFIVIQISSVQGQISELLKGVLWPWVLSGWAWMCIALWLLGYRWKVLLPSEVQVSGLFLGSALCSALLLNYAIPGPAGELASAWLVEKEIKQPYSRILAAGAVARLIGLMVAAMGTALIWIFADFQVSSSLQLTLEVGVYSIFSGGVFLAFLLLRPSWWRLKLAGLSKEGFTGKIVNALLRFIDAMIETAQLGRTAYIKALMWSVVGHLAALLGIVLSLYGMFQDYEIWGIAFTYLSTTSAGALAFLVPGSQLPWDAFFAGTLFSTTSLNLVQSTAAAALLRIEQMGMMLLGALMTWLLLRKALSSRTAKS